MRLTVGAVCCALLVVVAGCAAGPGAGGATTTTPSDAASDATTNSTETTRATASVATVPGWTGNGTDGAGGALDASRLVDAHVRALEAAGSFTVAVNVTPDEGDNRYAFHIAVNATQRRALGGWHTTLAGRDRGTVGYITTTAQYRYKVRDGERTYEKTDGVSAAEFEERFESYAAYGSGPRGFESQLTRLTYEYAGTVERGGETLFRFTGENETANATGVLIVSDRGVVRFFQYHNDGEHAHARSYQFDGVRTTYRYSGVGTTVVSAPAWLESAESAAGGDGSGDATTTVPADAVDATGKDRVEVRVQPDGDFRYEPGGERALYVTAGTTVEFVFVGDAPHTIVVESQPAAADWQGGPAGTEDYFRQGDTYEKTFTVTGTYEFYCGPHRPLGETGTIVVVSE